MRLLACLAAGFLPALGCECSENWFLPFQPDEHTLALVHLDGEGDVEQVQGRLEVTAKLRGDSHRGAGRFDTGVQLDGSDCGISLSGHKGLQMGYAEPFTVEMWFRPKTGANASLWSLGTRYYLKVAPGTGSWTFGYRAASFPIRFQSLAGPKIALHQWHHVALTHDETMTATVYLDGRAIGSVTHRNEGDYDKGAGAHFGSHDGWTAYFTGDIDEVRVSDVVRQYRPVLSQAALLPDERVSLAIDTDRLPAPLHSATVQVLDGFGKPVMTRELPREDLSSELFSGSALPEAPPLSSADARAIRASQAKLEVEFLDADGRRLTSLSVPVQNIGAQLEDITSAADELLTAAQAVASRKALARRVAGLELLADRARRLGQERRPAEAYERIVAGQRVAAALGDGETTYRARLRKAARAATYGARTRITMSWPGDAGTPTEALEWAGRLGANEIATYLSAEPADLRAWKQAGMRTVALGSLPVHLNAHLNDHVEQSQIGWWVTVPVTATSDEVTVPIVSPTWGGGKICGVYEPAEHWRVLDRTSGRFVPAEMWRADETGTAVAVSGATEGHQYQVYFMVLATGVGDVLLPEFQESGLAALDEALGKLDGVLDTYWFDDLAYAYPGPTPQGVWDWEAYVYMARPERLARFQADTGIAFDPRWLVNAPHTIEAPAPREYLEWMYWVQPRVDAWMRKATDVVRKHGMDSWLYWGDTHVGTEPFLGSLDAGGVEQLDKPAADPVTMRALTDFPGDPLRRFRVDWVFDHKAVSPRFSAQLRDQWARVRRGLLMKPIHGIYWMPFENAATNTEEAVREDLVETVAEINDEFRLIADNLAGHRAWTADLDVYVLNVWGKQYSWRPWGESRLVPFTDMPVRMHFLSLLQVQRQGIPPDADVLVCYGMPNTAQNGGHWWSDEAIVQAVASFVRAGGGFIGLQAPSAHGANGRMWPLAEMLGIRPEGTADYSPAALDASLLADVGGDLPPPARGSATLIPTLRASGHWLARRGQAVPHVSLSVRATARSQDQIVYAADAGQELLPGLVARQEGKGRTVWLAGHSASAAFDKLLRDAVFWAARAEAEGSRLEVIRGDQAYVYAYPPAATIAVHNASRAPAQVTCRIDEAALGLPGPGGLQDLATGERFDVRQGMLAVSVPAQCTRLLRYQPEGDQQ